MLIFGTGILCSNDVVFWAVVKEPGVKIVISGDNHISIVSERASFAFPSNSRLSSASGLELAPKRLSNDSTEKYLARTVSQVCCAKAIPTAAERRIFEVTAKAVPARIYHC